MDKGTNKLSYSSQLDFKQWVLEKLGTSKDLFYFDYVFGVDSETDEDIPGLTADGSLNWSEGLNAIERHFNVQVSMS